MENGTHAQHTACRSCQCALGQTHPTAHIRTDVLMRFSLVSTRRSVWCETEASHTLVIYCAGKSGCSAQRAVYTAVAATRGGFTRRNQIVAVGFNLVLYLMYQVPGGAIVLFLFCYFFPFVRALNPDLHFSHGSTAGSSSKEHRRTCLQRNR